MRNWSPIATFQSYRQSYYRARKSGVFQASPPAVLAGGFLLLIALGTALLSLPQAQREPFSLFQAFFTATSAVTVTGLSIIEPGLHLTRFGQIVLMALVQIGGLGFVTLAVVAALTLGRRISLKQQALVLEAFNQTSVSKVRHTAFAVFKISISIQLIGALVLALWWMRDFPPLHAIYRALFYATMGFNNAGFSLLPGSLTGRVGDAITILTITSLIILGGIGFNVLGEAWQKRAWKPLGIYAKTLILATLFLNLAAFLLILALEWRNPLTMGDLPLHAKALAAWMQAVTTRTAGFNSVDTIHLNDTTTLVMMALMFIGGGSLSTASGIKLGTFIVLLAAVRSYLLHRQEVVLMQRTISPETVQKALTLVMVTTASAFTGLFLISLFEDAPFLELMFEVISAISTTGLSRGMTAQLSTPSQALLMILMFIGRLGPLTLMYSLATQRRSRIRYPESQFQVG